MSRRRDIQTAQPGQEFYSGLGWTRIVAETTPTDSKAGYAKGCTWQNLAGSAGSMFYINIGTATSSNWLNVA